MREIIKKNRMIAAVYSLTVVIYLGSMFVSPNFASWHHLMLTLILASFLMVVSYGQGIVILVRGLDLSVGSMITLSGVLVGAWISPTNQGILWAIPLIFMIFFVKFINNIIFNLIHQSPGSNNKFLKFCNIRF